ncbi:MAG: sodium/proline symporter PutP [Oscillospiraceae bacterium]|nr:sodium/proline symporter PutP [Oscillospiraceae bacterium]
MNVTELVVFIIYFILVLVIGLYFFLKTRHGGEKEFFLGGRKMNGLVSALSAGASDMSSWVLMGLPASVFTAGLGEAWIAIGLAIGTILSWILVAPRLRRFSIVADDSITLPQYLTKRFKTNNKALQIICAIIFICAYAIYAASSIKACGTLFSTVIPALDPRVAMYIAAAIIIVYTFLGGFSAVCWTDFFQGLLMLAALMLAPIIALFAVKGGSGAIAAGDMAANYWSLLPSGRLDWASISGILTGLAWGLGYFGMPHIIIRYMAIKSPKEVKKSRVIGSIWTCLILFFAVAVGLVGRVLLGDSISDSSTVFISMVRMLFPAVISGILLSAILAAAMSTADSQLLASASAFASDVYKPVFRKKAGDKEMIWIGRVVVIIISIVAVLIAANPNSGSIMNLVSNAWGVFGAAFGPVILLSLFWKKLSFGGAIAGIVCGAGVDILWLIFCGGTGIYELLPGFVAGIIGAVIVSLIKAPSKEVQTLFEEAKAYDK